MMPRQEIEDHASSDPDVCADCGGPIGQDDGPPDGWQLEDGRTVCQRCCVADLHKFVQLVTTMNRLLPH